MKKLLRVSLIGTLSKCIAELILLKQKLINWTSAPDEPSRINPDEYFIGNESCADYLGIGVRTLQTYVATGLIKSFHEGKFACYRKSDIQQAVENVPFLKKRFEEKQSGHFRNLPPALITDCRVVSDTLMFIYMSYQGWRCIVCASSKIFGNQKIIVKLCKEVIMIQHGIKPFKIDPNDN
jgi:hypothetical protein